MSSPNSCQAATACLTLLCVQASWRINTICCCHMLLEHCKIVSSPTSVITWESQTWDTSTTADAAARLTLGVCRHLGHKHCAAHGVRVHAHSKRGQRLEASVAAAVLHQEVLLAGRDAEPARIRHQACAKGHRVVLQPARHEWTCSSSSATGGEC
jgi:hypothetical protein